MVVQRALLTAFVLTSLLISRAYSNTSPDDFLRSSGKIYVVVGVLVLIFLLIVGYLVYLDRNIRTLENQSPNGENQ